MGLDVSHDAWSGAYSSFYRWRMGVAKAAGYEIVSYPDRGEREMPKVWLDESFAIANYMGEWERLPEDPLLVLMIHSDCDGIIPANATRWLADRLEGLLPALPVEDDDRLRIKTERFIAGLRDAASRDEDVEFF